MRFEKMKMLKGMAAGVLVVITLFIQSCASSSTQQSKYFGYNNNPEREQNTPQQSYKVKEIKPKPVSASQAANGQPKADGWVNPMASQRSEQDLKLEDQVTERERTVVNNYYYYQPRAFVPVIQPWHSGYRGWAAPNRGLNVSLSVGGAYGNPFYDPWHDWYNPWYDYHPYYGYSWRAPRRSTVWYNDPWAGRSNVRRDYRQTRTPSNRRSSGVTRSTNQGENSSVRRGTRGSSVNQNNGVRQTSNTRSTKYGTQTQNQSNSNSNSNSRRGTKRSSRYNDNSNSSGNGKSYTPSKRNGSSRKSNSSGVKRSSRSGGSKKSTGSSSGSSKKGSTRRR